MNALPFYALVRSFFVFVLNVIALPGKGPFFTQLKSCCVIMEWNKLIFYTFFTLFCSLDLLEKSNHESYRSTAKFIQMQAKFLANSQNQKKLDQPNCWFGLV